MQHNSTSYLSLDGWAWPTYNWKVATAKPNNGCNHMQNLPIFKVSLGNVCSLLQSSSDVKVLNDAGRNDKSHKHACISNKTTASWKPLPLSNYTVPVQGVSNKQQSQSQRTDIWNARWKCGCNTCSTRYAQEPQIKIIPYTYHGKVMREIRDH